MSECLCFCSNDVFMTLWTLVPVFTYNLQTWYQKPLQVCELGAQCVHSNTLTWELKGSSYAAQLFHFWSEQDWSPCWSLYWMCCITDWQLMKWVSLNTDLSPLLFLLLSSGGRIDDLCECEWTSRSVLREDQLDPDDPGPESGSGFSHLHLSYLTDNKLNS